MRIFIAIIIVLLLAPATDATVYEWTLGQPVQSDTTNYEWSMGQPYVITEVAAAGGQVIIINMW